MEIKNLYQINIEMLIFEDEVRKITLIDGLRKKFIPISPRGRSPLGPVPPPPPPIMSKEQLEALIKVLKTYCNVT